MVRCEFPECTYLAVCRENGIALCSHHRGGWGRSSKSYAVEIPSPDAATNPTEPPEQVGATDVEDLCRDLCRNIVPFKDHLKTGLHNDDAALVLDLAQRIREAEPQVSKEDKGRRQEAVKELPAKWRLDADGCDLRRDQLILSGELSDEVRYALIHKADVFRACANELEAALRGEE